jgi:hypothetical protein
MSRKEILQDQLETMEKEFGLVPEKIDLELDAIIAEEEAKCQNQY